MTKTKYQLLRSDENSEAGGHEIGAHLAEKLEIPLYDKEMLDRASKDSGIAEEILKAHDEKPTSSFLYSLVMDTYSLGYKTGSYSDMPINHKIFLAQFEAIKKIADEGPCILIGRCADYAWRITVMFYPYLFMQIRQSVRNASAGCMI